jgi:hypothetical protein
MHNWEQYNRLPAYLLAATLVASCGGGSGGDKETLSGEAQVTISTTNSGAEIESGATKTFPIILKDAAGTPLANQQLTAYLENGFGSFTRKTVTTDAVGSTGDQIAIVGTATAGDGALVVSYKAADDNIKVARFPFSIVAKVTPDSSTDIPSSFRLEAGVFTDPAGAVISQITTSGSKSLANATVKIFDASGAPVSGQNIQVTLSDSSNVQLGSSSVTSNASGIATVSLAGIAIEGQPPFESLKQLNFDFTDKFSRKATRATLSFIVRDGNIVRLEPSKPIVNSGLDTVDLTAFVLNEAGAGVKGQVVSFELVKDSARQDGKLSTSSVVTDDTGRAVSRLTLGKADDSSTHDITVRARVGAGGESSGREAKTTVAVKGGVLTLTPSASTVDTNGLVTLTATLKYADDSAAVSKKLTLLNSAGVPIGAQVTTDAAGQAKFVQAVPATTTFSVRADDASFCFAQDATCPSEQQTISVSPVTYVMKVFNKVGAGACTNPASFGTELSASDILKINSNYIVTLDVEENGTTNNNARSLSLAASLGKVAGQQAATTTVTDTDGVTTHFKGQACFDVVSTIPGLSILESNTVTAAGALLTASRSVNFISDVPAKISAQAAQTNLLPLGQTQIIASVLDVNDTPVQGHRVYFNLVDTSAGGKLSATSAITDASGVATVTYTAGTHITAKDAVTITAQPESSSLFSTAALTVGGKSTFVSLATGIDLDGSASTIYRQPFSVTVADANGQPIANTQVSLSVTSFEYYKGFYHQPTDTTKSEWDFTHAATCPNEDLNQNGHLDITENDGATGIGVIDNADGKLWPGGPAVVSVGTLTTDANGIATFNVQYGKTFANWLKVRLVASALVQGTETTSERQFDLGATVPDMAKTHTPPGGQLIGPFGQASDCTDPN